MDQFVIIIIITKTITTTIIMEFTIIFNEFASTAFIIYVIFSVQIKLALKYFMDLLDYVIFVMISITFFIAFLFLLLLHHHHLPYFSTYHHTN